MYSEQQKKFLLTLARKSIASYLEDKTIPQIKKNDVDPVLAEKRGVFVTLTLNSRLRGCIGSIIPEKTLFEEVIDNAVNAAFEDPRFDPLRREELSFIKIEISVLTTPQKLEYKDSADLVRKLRPNIDGVIISKSPFNKATYLPQVWEDLPVAEDFLSNLCLKAGISSEAWEQDHLKVETYQAEHFEENHR
jgi:AmmeMemoRadiSam system protein A